MEPLAVRLQVAYENALALVWRYQFEVRVPDGRERDSEGEGKLSAPNCCGRRLDRPDTPRSDPGLSQRRRRPFHVVHDEAVVMERA